MIPVSCCPLCSSERHQYRREASCTRHPLWRPEFPPVVMWVECVDCDHVYTSSVFDADEQARLFSLMSPLQTPGHELEAKRLGWAPTIRNVAALQSAGRWLDVGFGDGAAMFVADEFGFDVAGIDVRPGVVEAMVAIGFDATVDTVETVGGVWDVVSMFDTLEHLVDPLSAVRHVFDLLTPGGVFSVSCPNMGSVVWDALDAENRNPYWGEIEHYHNFSRERLVALLEDCGFDVVGFNIPDRWRLGMELYARRGER
jgi:protein O-GlcNAc transferase